MTLPGVVDQVGTRDIRPPGAQGRRGEPVSYRTFKHLLGETSLERKCRFIFGGGILVLVTLSFYWYGRKTESLVIGQNTQAARMQIKSIVEGVHTKYEAGVDFAPVLEKI